jgi:16S rRNA processing protein RimM
VTGTVEVVVGLVGRAHGLRGEVFVVSWTDEVDRRFAPGSVLHIEGTSRTLTVATVRRHSGALLVGFREATDRMAADALRGSSLAVHVDADERPADAEEYYDRQLRGLRVLDHEGSDVGSITDVLHLPAQDVLVVRTAAGERYAPFVSAIVEEIDLDSRTVRLAHVAGLLEDESEETD